MAAGHASPGPCETPGRCCCEPALITVNSPPSRAAAAATLGVVCVCVCVCNNAALDWCCRRCLCCCRCVRRWSLFLVERPDDAPALPAGAAAVANASRLEREKATQGVDAGARSGPRRTAPAVQTHPPRRLAGGPRTGKAGAMVSDKIHHCFSVLRAARGVDGEVVVGSRKGEGVGR